MLPWRTSCPLSQVAVKPVPTGGLRPAEPVGKKVRKSQHIFGKGQNGVSINGVTANFMLFDRGTFWSLPFTYYLPKSARAYLFPQSVKFITFAAAPLVLTPFVRNHVSLTHMATGRLRRDDVHLHAVLRAPLSPPME